MTSVVAPMCLACARFHKAETSLSCTAFPGGIPEPIIHSIHDHRKPYPGDNDLLFEMDPEWASLPDKPGLLGRLPAAPDA